VPAWLAALEKISRRSFAVHPTGNTILITGGGSGIGRGLAQALHGMGNKVIIAGRRKTHLEAVASAYPGMATLALDLADPVSISQAAQTLVAEHPSLNVLINNAGIMLGDDAARPIEENVLLDQVQTNLMGSIRLTSSLIEHLKTKERAWVIYNSSVLAFTPLAAFAVYSATKAGLHSYAMSQRFMLRDTAVSVQELIPPWVATELLGEPDPRAMPLDAFISQALAILIQENEEILVEQAKIPRNNVGPGEYAYLNDLNTFMSSVMG
jgi:uncharacterized oxidoreductase